MNYRYSLLQLKVNVNGYLTLLMTFLCALKFRLVGTIRAEYSFKFVFEVVRANGAFSKVVRFVRFLGSY